jgi:hypothetical protein
MSFISKLQKYVLQNENLEEFSKTNNSWPLLDHKLIVYRGHGNSEIIRKSNFYSTSKDIDLVYNNFTSKTCCIFKIHVMPNIKYVDVNKIMGTNHRYADDKEVILDGNGEFYKDNQRKIKGFNEIELYKGKKVFETYYFPNKKKVSRKTLMNRFNKNELELYSTENDLLNAFKTVLKNDEEFNNSTNITRKQKGGTINKLDIRQILITKPMLEQIKNVNMSQFTIQKGNQGFPLTRMKSMKTIKKSKFKSFLQKNPVIVKSTPYGKTINGEKKRLYELIDGRHRLTRAISLGKKTIQVKII